MHATGQLRRRRRYIRSMRTRLSLWVVVLALVVVVALGVFLYISVDRGLRNTLDDSLEVSASLAAATVTAVDGRLVLGESMPENNSDMRLLLAQDNTVLFINADGTVLDGSIPPGKLKLVAAWVEIHKEDLIADWELASSGQKAFAIDPLK